MPVSLKKEKSLQRKERAASLPGWRALEKVNRVNKGKKKRKP